MFCLKASNKNVKIADVFFSGFLPSSVHARKLTWIPKMMVWKRWTPLKYGHVWYVRFLGCKQSDFFFSMVVFGSPKRW